MKRLPHRPLNLPLGGPSHTGLRMRAWESLRLGLHTLALFPVKERDLNQSAPRLVPLLLPSLKDTPVTFGITSLLTSLAPPLTSLSRPRPPYVGSRGYSGQERLPFRQRRKSCHQLALDGQSGTRGQAEKRHERKKSFSVVRRSGHPVPPGPGQLDLAQVYLECGDVPRLILHRDEIGKLLLELDVLPGEPLPLAQKERLRKEVPDVGPQSGSRSANLEPRPLQVARGRIDTQASLTRHLDALG